MEEERIIIDFESIENRTDFVDWLEKEGFKQFTQKTKTHCSCLIVTHDGKPEKEEDYGEITYIEIQ